MQSKRELGQYFTTENPFNHPLFREWMVSACHETDMTILEPFAGANNIPRMMADSGYNNKWRCYDIAPSENNTFPEYAVEERDTIKDFPTGYAICVTNCPYLGKSSARRRKIDYPWDEDDLYKVCLDRMLGNCGYVAAIIPESFITAGIHTDRLWGVVSLACRMFDDTECPVCLAMFTPNGSEQTRVYANEEYLGTLEELHAADLADSEHRNRWAFNDKEGSVGVKTVDSQKRADCGFFEGELIDPSDIKVSSRSFTRVSGLPESVNRSAFIAECNRILGEYRVRTKDVLMTSFKGLRADGRYRRRLDFRTVRRIMDLALDTIGDNQNNRKDETHQ